VEYSVVGAGDSQPATDPVVFGIFFDDCVHIGDRWLGLEVKLFLNRGGRSSFFGPDAEVTCQAQQSLDWGNQDELVGCLSHNPTIPF